MFFIFFKRSLFVYILKELYFYFFKKLMIFLSFFSFFLFVFLNYNVPFLSNKLCSYVFKFTILWIFSLKEVFLQYQEFLISLKFAQSALFLKTPHNFFKSLNAFWILLLFFLFDKIYHEYVTYFLECRISWIFLQYCPEFLPKYVKLRTKFHWAMWTAKITKFGWRKILTCFKR